jgi:hypothetical protein
MVAAKMRVNLASPRHFPLPNSSSLLAVISANVLFRVAAIRRPGKQIAPGVTSER